MIYAFSENKCFITNKTVENSWKLSNFNASAIYPVVMAIEEFTEEKVAGKIRTASSMCV